MTQYHQVPASIAIYWPINTIKYQLVSLYNSSPFNAQLNQLDSFSLTAHLMSHAQSTWFSGCIFFHMHRSKIFCQIFPDIAQQYFASVKWCLRGSLYSFYPYFTPTLNILSFGLFSLAICCTCTKYFQFSVNLGSFVFLQLYRSPCPLLSWKSRKCQSCMLDHLVLCAVHLWHLELAESSR